MKKHVLHFCKVTIFVTVKISRNLVYISLKPYLKREVLVKGTAKLLHANSQINNCRF